MIDLDKLQDAVNEAGGVQTAAAELKRDASTIRRWLKGESTIPGTWESTVNAFIRDHPSDIGTRPLNRFSDDALVSELVHRLALQDRANDPRRLRRSTSVSAPTRAQPQGKKAGRSRLDGVRGDAKGDTNAGDAGESRA